MIGNPIHSCSPRATLRKFDRFMLVDISNLEGYFVYHEREQCHLGFYELQMELQQLFGAQARLTFKIRVVDHNRSYQKESGAFSSAAINSSK
jgi:hypothetical protein